MMLNIDQETRYRTLLWILDGAQELGDTRVIVWVSVLRDLVVAQLCAELGYPGRVPRIEVSPRTVGFEFD